MLTCFIGPDAKTASFLGCSLSGTLQVAVQVRSSIFKKKEKKKNKPNYMHWKPSKILWRCTFPVWGGFTWSSQTRDVNPRQDGNTDAAAGLWRSKPALGLGCAPCKPGGDAQFAVVVNDMHCSGAACVSPSAVTSCHAVVWGDSISFDEQERWTCWPERRLQPLTGSCLCQTCPANSQRRDRRGRAQVFISPASPCAAFHIPSFWTQLVCAQLLQCSLFQVCVLSLASLFTCPKFKDLSCVCLFSQVHSNK